MKRKVLLLALILTVVLSCSIISFAEPYGWNGDYTMYNTEENGEAPAVYATGIATLEDGIYKFNEDGIVQTGVFDKVEDCLYYFGEPSEAGQMPPAGVKYTGVYNKDGKRYDKGVLLTGLYDGKRYKNGELLTGPYNNKRYSKGVLLTGFYDNKYYSNGVRYSGFTTHYYYNNGVKYKPSKSGIHKLKSNYYYVNKSGYIYYPKSSGVHKMKNGKYYYIFKSGHVKKVSKKGKYTINGKKYYLNSNSSIIMTGKNCFKKISGATYRISKKGYLIKGWQTINGHKYYMSKTTYKRFQGGVKKVNGERYYFSKTGKMFKNKWYYSKGLKKYYFGKTGKTIKKCSKYIGKYKYYFNKKGVCQTNLVKYKGYDWVLKHALKVDVDITHQVVTIYAKDGKKGYTIPVVAFICTTGAWDRPTDIGDYRTGAIYRWKELGGKTEEEDNGEKCYGQYVTHIYGHVFFHSIVCEENGNNHTLYTSAYNWLGNRGSHGCVRLRTGDAYIMYNLAARQNMWVHIGYHNKVGAFGKPELKPIYTCYDPTDPNIK